MKRVGRRESTEWRGFWLLVLALLTSGCRDRLSAPDVVARVGDRSIVYGEFEDFLQRNSVDPELALGEAALSGLFDQFLEEEMLRELALERGLVDAGQNAAAALEALLENAGLPAAEEARVEEFYRSHQALFERPERVRVSQILVETRGAAEEALAEIEAGAPFAEVARRYSREPAAPRGGDQGILAREDLPPVFADVIFALEEGEVSAVVAVDYGFHIFQVTQRLPAETTALEDAAPEIRRRLSGNRAAEEHQRLVREASGRYNVRVDERNLPFRYLGIHRDG